jgi:toxin CcdB
MAQYDVFANPDGGGYLLDVQTDLLDALNVRVVVPLMPQDRAPSRDRDCEPVHAVLTRQH